MAKLFLFLVFHIFLILIVFNSEMVKSKRCEETIGASKDECNSKCASKYPSGRGSYNISSNSCTCLYHCDNPLPTTKAGNKECNVGLGLCSQRCNDVCCNENCVARYPTQHSSGFCFAPGPTIYQYCLCKFDC